jgi:F-type H+-transporting ATPase subunit epsilon
MTLRVNIVAADGKRTFDGEADMVVAPSVGGEIGLLTGHEPVMTLLKTGTVKMSAGDKSVLVDIQDGWLSLYDDEVSIVVDSAKIR